MAEMLQVGDRQIPAAEIISLIAGYQMLPQLLREILIDQAITEIECTPEEKAAACQQFYHQHNLNSDTEQQAWLVQNWMTPAQLETLAVRGVKIEKFKQATWGHRLEADFLQQKSKYDQFVYSLIRTQDVEIAQELYFRIQEGEQSFAELARVYSQGPEAQTGGLVGPVEASRLHPTLVKMLSVSQPGQLLAPNRLGEWIVIVRLEQSTPAQLDAGMKRQLLHDSFETWLQSQLEQLQTTTQNPALASAAS